MTTLLRHIVETEVHQSTFKIIFNFIWSVRWQGKTPLVYQSEVFWDLLWDFISSTSVLPCSDFSLDPGSSPVWPSLLDLRWANQGRWWLNVLHTAQYSCVCVYMWVCVYVNWCFLALPSFLLSYPYPSLLLPLLALNWLTCWSCNSHT